MVRSTIMKHKVLKQMTTMFLGLGLLLFISCQDSLDVDPEDEYMVFGFFGGYCFGECAEFYKLTKDDVLVSNIDQYSWNGFFPSNDYHSLSQEQFNLVNDLWEFVPQELLQEPSTHIGQADVIDVGYLYFEIKKGSDHRYWVFENGDFEMPEVYSAFMSEIQKKMSFLR